MAYEELFDAPAVAEGVDESTAQPATGEGGNRQPQPAGTEPKAPAAAPSRINLDDLPEFREWKSNYDKRFGQTEKTLTQLQQQRQQEAERARWLENQLEQLQTKDLDEPGKLVFELQKRDRQIAALNQALQQQRIGEMKNQALLAIQSRARELGVTVGYEELVDQTDADAAWAFVLQKGLADAKKAAKPNGLTAEQRAEKSEANSVDLGGGQAVSTKSELQAKYDQASKEYNASEMLNIMQEAANGGVELTY